VQLLVGVMASGSALQRTKYFVHYKACGTAVMYHTQLAAYSLSSVFTPGGNHDDCASVFVGLVTLWGGGELKLYFKIYLRL
jgi:hypothetical protein